MLKATLFGFLLLLGSQAMNLKHEADINIDKLTDIQSKASKFMMQKVPNLKDALLAKGTQDNGTFKYQFLDKDAPIKMTQVQAERVKDDKNPDNVIFRLKDVVQMLNGPTEGGRLTSSKQVYGIQNFAEAVKKLKWN